MPPLAAPLSLGVVPHAGTVAFNDAGRRWSYDGATGRVTATEKVPPPDAPAEALAVAARPDSTDVAWIDADHKTFYRHGGVVHALLAERRICCLRWSPDGRLLSAAEMPPSRSPVPSDGRVATIGLWAIAPETAEAHLVYAAPALRDAREPPGWSSPFLLASWSPDGRFIALWKVPMVSASLLADGLAVSLFDVATGTETPLGTTLLYPWLAWRAPHTLAYIAGGDRFTWDHKTLRLWTPETGLRDLTGSDEIALAPTWSPDGREIVFVRGPAGPYVPLEHFSGTGVGARSLVALDPATGSRRTLTAAPRQVQEGVLLSQDGSARLELRRKTVPATWTPGQPDPPVEIWYVDAAGATPIVRLTTIGFGYYGAYPALASLTWDR